MWSVIDYMFFKLPTRNLQSLEALFDEVTFSDNHTEDPFCKFLSEVREEWTSFGITMPLTLLSLYAALLLHPHTVPAVINVSMLLCYAAFACATRLLHEYPHVNTRNLAPVKRYLKEVKEGPYGFRLYAIWLSTPKILFMWAVMTPSLEVQSWLGVPVRSYGPALLATALAVIGGVASQRGPILHVAKKMYKSYVQPSPQSSPRVQSINTVIDAPGAPRAKTVVKAPGAHSTETVADIV